MEEWQNGHDQPGYHYHQEQERKPVETPGKRFWKMWGPLLIKRRIIGDGGKQPADRMIANHGPQTEPWRSLRLRQTGQHSGVDRPAKAVDTDKYRTDGQRNRSGFPKRDPERFYKSMWAHLTSGAALPRKQDLIAAVMSAGSTTRTAMMWGALRQTVCGTRASTFPKPKQSPVIWSFSREPTTPPA